MGEEEYSLDPVKRGEARVVRPGHPWIIEDHLEAGPCASAGPSVPDECGAAFDDLLAAAHAKTPQAEMTRLKSANGGFRLAYQLMSSQLHQYSKVLATATRPSGHA